MQKSTKMRGGSPTVMELNFFLNFYVYALKYLTLENQNILVYNLEIFLFHIFHCALVMSNNSKNVLVTFQAFVYSLPAGCAYEYFRVRAFQLNIFFPVFLFSLFPLNRPTIMIQQHSPSPRVDGAAVLPKIFSQFFNPFFLNS